MSEEVLSQSCGFCRRFPVTWHDGRWKCRTAWLDVDRASAACAHWETGPPDEFDERLTRTNRMKDMHAQRAERRERAAREAEYQRANRPLIMLRETGGIVYVVDCDKYTKIGHTKGTAPERVLGLMGANPFQITIYALVHGTVSRERELHRIYRDYRHRNEWFVFPPAAKRKLSQRILRLGGIVYDGKHAPTIVELLADLERDGTHTST